MIRNSTDRCPAARLEGETVGCSTCTYLECALQSRHSEYIKACSGAFRQITSKLEAYDLVEMERARSELAMHRSVCDSAVAAAHERRSLEAHALSSV